MKNVSIFTINDDLDMLKSQMDLLTRCMLKQDLITDDMIRRTVEKDMRNVIPSRYMMYLSILFGGILFPGLVLWMTFSQGMYSPLLGIFTILISWFGVYRSVEYLKLNVQDVLQKGSLLEVSDIITRLQMYNNRSKWLVSVFFIIWVSWFMFENYSVFLSDRLQLIMSIVIFLVVIVGCSSQFIRVERTVKHSLDYINDMKS